MKAAHAWLIGNALLCVSVVTYAVQNMESAAAAQAGKPYAMHRLYTGPDGKTHVEEIELKNYPFKLKAAAGAEIRSAPAGRVVDWHPAPRRQYVITLSGRGEVGKAKPAVRIRRVVRVAAARSRRVPLPMPATATSAMARETPPAVANRPTLPKAALLVELGGARVTISPGVDRQTLGVVLEVLAKSGGRA